VTDVGAAAYRGRMPEQVQAWWARRQRSKSREVPYAVGTYRSDWERYPVLARQYHPDLNNGITLTQVPPAADVWLLWQCEAGHEFVATPWEQRQRPGRTRRRSTWCPECAAVAVAPRALMGQPRPQPARRAKPAKPMCRWSGGIDLAVGEAFASVCAPKPASAAEARLRQLLSERLEFEPGLTAVRTSRPFFDHLEVWPDIVLGELRVAIEYDTTGRDGLEHVGKREDADRRKDRVLRASGWEVVRIRTGKLKPIGPYDVAASAPSARVVERVIDRLGEIRGHLIVSCYTRRDTSQAGFVHN
jgi:hypothetical protein